MKVTSLTPLALAALLDSVTAANCNSDNCLNALNPTGRHLTAAIAQGSSFCNTFTQSTYKSVNFPAQATNACGGTVPSAYPRWSSACSCAFPAAVTPPPTTPTAATTATACITDNCRQAFWTTGAFEQSEAASLCEVLKTSTIKSTHFPAHATAACGYDKPKYSSVCACGSASTTATAPSCTTSDACRAALFPNDYQSQYTASSFCNTFTQSSVKSTSFPAFATAACGTGAADASKYRAACSCGPSTTATAPVCSKTADGCRTALFSVTDTIKLASASAFCSTITQSSVKSTHYPEYATATCGSAAEDVERYRRACSCAMPAPATQTAATATAPATAAATATAPATAAATATSAPANQCDLNNKLRNGDFEQTGAPPAEWAHFENYQDALPATPIEAKQGLAYTGKSAAYFNADTWYPSRNISLNGFQEKSISQTVSLDPTVQNGLAFRFYFPTRPVEQGYEGHFWVKINGNSLLDISYSKYPTEFWFHSAYKIASGTKAANIEFGVRADKKQGVTVYVDTVWVGDISKSNPCQPSTIQWN